MFCIASECEVQRLLLGAWGCGAFRGDPVMAAETALLALQQAAAPLREVVFAIPSQGKQSLRNLEAFQEQFAK